MQSEQCQQVRSAENTVVVFSQAARGRVQPPGDYIQIDHSLINYVKQMC